MATISAALQDYLEAVLFVERQKGEARVADLAAFLNVKSPSVVKSLNRLKELGLIEQQPYGPVVLTKRGRAEAQDVSRRHDVLKDFLSRVLMIDDKLAEQDACRIEHVISARTFERLTAFVTTYKKKKG
ncbi:MAG TPA: metal-dependent transcriptional regulator [Candidatus Bathyarchaeia archaeon]|nr:metal-dependent transcriptional regulator [Candidatus Bathyarchaeia archaeon]